MRIDALKIADLRVIEQLELRPAPGLNFIVGANGAGKTSILEAIYLAGRGRTFRHSDAGPMIRQGAPNAMVVLELWDDIRQRISILGVRRERRLLTCRLDGQDLTRRSAMAEALPVQWISSQPQLLLGLGPDTRRRFVDMGLFHVEQSYLQVFSEFQRILKQRNAAIRQGTIDGVRIWDQPFNQAALALNASRERYVEDLMKRVAALVERWGLGFRVSYRYRPGWHAKDPLDDQLRAKAELDMRMGYSTIGPQRADLEILADDVNAERNLSRGQQKILVLALNIAMLDATTAQRGRAPVLLIDDLAAELDVRNRATIVEELEARPAQVFLAMIEEGALRPRQTPARMFHVEHGALERVAELD